jgi:hypothetical protein
MLFPRRFHMPHISDWAMSWLRQIINWKWSNVLVLASCKVEMSTLKKKKYTHTCTIRNNLGSVTLFCNIINYHFHAYIDNILIVFIKYLEVIIFYIRQKLNSAYWRLSFKWTEDLMVHISYCQHREIKHEENDQKLLWFDSTFFKHTLWWNDNPLIFEQNLSKYDFMRVHTINILRSEVSIFVTGHS